MRPFWTCLVAILFPLSSGCESTGQAVSSPAAEADAADDAAAAQDSNGQDADPQDGGLDAADAAAPTNLATVFLVDPVTTPTPSTVELGWVADDADGHLTSAAGADGVRLLQAMTCLDEGETNAFNFEQQRICTLRQLANKNTFGSFEYPDYDGDVACKFAPANTHAEVNLYYHAQKIYALVTAPEVGVFDRLPGRHEVDGKPVPLTLVANYQAPSPPTSSALHPTDVAFFLPHEYLAMGMAAYQGLVGVPGDVLVFGQGTSKDFAYAGETVYHEFGHAVVHSTASLNQVFADRQGLTNQPTALNEGIANTMAFLGSGEPLMGEYLDACSNQKGWTFDATNEDRFPDDQVGHPVADGNPILAANYLIHETMVKSWGGTSAQFMRILLLSLLELKNKNGNALLADYAEAFTNNLAAEGFSSSQVDEAGAIFTTKGLLQTDRVVDLTGASQNDGRWLMMRGAATQPWNTWMVVDDGGASYPLATAYVQHRIDVPDTATQAVITAQVEEMPSFAAPGDLDFRLFTRVGSSIEYSKQGASYTVEMDAQVEPEVSTSGSATRASWTFPVQGGSTVYVQFVNRGTSEGILSRLDQSFLP